MLANQFTKTHSVIRVSFWFDIECYNWGMAIKNISDLNSVLTPEQYKVLREKSTEAPFSGQYLNNTSDGIYTCASCSTELFSSSDKYESDIDSLKGWPSFADVVRAGAVELKADDSHSMERIEAICANCGGHLGHLFDDELSPTGKHYCINSLSLDFIQTTQHKSNKGVL